MFHSVAPVVVEGLVEFSALEQVEFVVAVGVAVEDNPVLEGVSGLFGGDVGVPHSFGLLVGPYAGEVVGFPGGALVVERVGGYRPVPSVVVEVVEACERPVEDGGQFGG